MRRLANATVAVKFYGDAYAGQTFRAWTSPILHVDYVVEKQSRTDLYENLEVALNAGQVQLLDLPKLRSEMMTIIRRGASLDHMPGRHDDWATSAAGALTLVNPVLGQDTPGMLTFYARQAAAAKAEQELPPTPAKEHAAEAVMQLGTKRPADHVMVRIPGAPSHVYGRSGVPYITDVVDGERIAWMSPDDAWEFISSPLNVVAFELNAGLRQSIGKSVRQPRGIRISDMLAAIEDAAPPHPTDTARIAAQSLAMMARAR